MPTQCGAETRSLAWNDMIPDHTMGTMPKTTMSTTAGSVNAHPARCSEPSARRTLESGARLNSRAFRDHDPVKPLYSGDVGFYQQLWLGGTVTFSYRVRTDDIPPNSVLDTTARIVSEDDYIVTTSELTEHTDFIIDK